MDATSPAVIGGKSTTEFGYNSKIEGEVVHTTVDAALNWFRKNSLWPMPMGLAISSMPQQARPMGMGQREFLRSCASLRASPT